ncbi:MAG TPA: ATP-grasp domain-containing protein [Patescibacteria group bacterium]|nr:ATP-grasp domain-containing protein [Patescibacteria group bacterium]
MKKVLLLFSKLSIVEGLTHPDDLVKLLNESGENIEASAATLEDLIFYFDGDKAEIMVDHEHKLGDYQAVYFRHWSLAPGHGLAAARYCKLRGIPFVDKEVLRTGSQNKISQYMNLYEAKVDIPKTLIGNTKRLEESYAEFGFSFPMILKSISGTRGQDNYLARDQQAMRRIFAQNPNVIFVMQEFIANDGDYRVIVMGDEVVAVIRRQATGDTHLNNTSQGGSAKLVPVTDLPSEVCEMSVRAAKFFGRDIAGVDIVKSLDNGKYYCFEVNRAPQIEHSSFEHEKAVLLARYLKSL